MNKVKVFEEKRKHIRPKTNTKVYKIYNKRQTIEQMFTIRFKEETCLKYGTMVESYFTK